MTHDAHAKTWNIGAVCCNCLGTGNASADRRYAAFRRAIGRSVKCGPAQQPTSTACSRCTTTLPYVFACGENRPAGKCVVGSITPGSRETPANTALAVDHEQDGWSCVSLDAVTGWVPSNRLASLPSQPSVPESWWLGWWRMGPHQTGIQNDRLLITKSDVPGQLRVSGRAYWSESTTMST